VTLEASRLPELPRVKLGRFLGLGVPEEASIFLSEELDLARYFDEGLAEHPEVAAPLAQLIMGELLRELKDDLGGIREAKVSASTLVHLVRARSEGKISSTQQKKLFAVLWREGGDIEALLRQEGEQVSDNSALEPVIDRVIVANPSQVAEYRSGKTKLMSFFVGQVMKEMRGKANPQAAQDLLAAKLGAE
jgi:aspartyl-tRNA(Asn)/glutamyl-tRNA(Gln) amidotransferase subunit B